MRIAAEECARHPFRTFLVSQGMLWAVALVVIPAAVIGGSRRQALERASELGTDLLQIEPSPGEGGAAAPREEDLLLLQQIIGPEGRLAALRVEPLDLGPGEEPAWWIGAGDRHLSLSRRSLAEGSWPGVAEREDGSLEVALESSLAAAILPESSFPDGVLGARLRLWQSVGPRAPARLEILANGAEPQPRAPARRDLVVVGIVAQSASAGVDRFGLEEDRTFTALIHELMETLGVSPRPVPFLDSGRGVFVDRSHVEGEHLDWIFLRADPARIGEIELAVEECLVSHGRTPLIYSNAAWSILSRPELDGYMALHDIFFWLSTGVGLAVVGNLLLLAGSRRRREIALRLAEGARRSDIFSQFIAEGVILAAVGIVLGVFTGMGIAWLRVKIDPNILLTIDWPWRTIAGGASILLVGALAASAVPAWRASRHAPVDLLRRA